MMEHRNFFLSVGAGILIVILFSVLTTTVNNIKESDFRKEYYATDSAYRSVLSSVGQKSSDTPQRMGEFISSWEKLFNHYRLKAPPPLSSDEAWRNSMNSINSIVKESESFVAEGKLDDAYVSLERFGTSWRQIFDRNTASMIGFYLLGFRDVMDDAVVEAGVLDYARLEDSCVALGERWNDVRNSPVYLQMNRAADFDDYLWKEKLAIDSFCEAVAARDDAKVRDSAVQMKKGFEEVYVRYN